MISRRRRRRRKPLWTSGSALWLGCCSLRSTLLFMPLSFVPVAAERCSDARRPPEGSSELQRCSPHCCPAASTGDGVSESGGMFLFVLQPQRQEATTRTKCWVIYFVVVDVFIIVFSRCRRCSGHILKTYNRLKKWNKSEAWTEYLMSDVAVVVLTVFLHPYTGVLWLIGAARSVFLSLITCFLPTSLWVGVHLHWAAGEGGKTLWKMAGALRPMPPCWRVEPLSAEVFLSNITLMALLWVMTISPTPSLTCRSLISARGAPVRLR